MFDLTQPHTLSADDQALAKTYALHRQTAKVALGIRDGKYSSRPGVDLHLDGTKSEIAFARIVGQEPHQIDTAAGDGGHQDYVVQGIRVSLKSVQMGKRLLLIPPKQWPPQSDITILYLLDDDRVSPLGWATTEYLIAHCERKSFGHGRPPCWAMPIDLLLPMQDLQAAFEDGMAATARADAA